MKNYLFLMVLSVLGFSTFANAESANCVLSTGDQLQVKQVQNSLRLQAQVIKHDGKVQNYEGLGLQILSKQQFLQDEKLQQISQFARIQSKQVESVHAFVIQKGESDFSTFALYVFFNENQQPFAKVVESGMAVEKCQK